MTRPPTVYDVAARAGVSIATVSRVLSRPSDVAASTRERVTAAVDELGYVRNVSARSLAGSRTHVLGLLLPAYDDEGEPAPRADGETVGIRDDRLEIGTGPEWAQSLYYDEIVRGAERAASAADHALLIAAGRRTDRERLLRDIAGRVDGLVVVASSLSPTALERVARRIPVVLLAGGAEPPGLDRIVAANADGMRTLVAGLLADPHVRRIAYVDGPLDSPDARERRRGLEEAVAGCDVTLRILPGDFSESAGDAAATRLLDEGADALPDALVCANDQTALGALAALQRAGVGVPERVLVTGFDGVDAGRFSAPRLTTVRQPMSDLGFLATRMLLERLADRDAPPVTRVLPVDLLLRESAPPASAAPEPAAPEPAAPESVASAPSASGPSASGSTVNAPIALPDAV